MADTSKARKNPASGSRKQRDTRKLTAIACYECRKRKCKCDGAKPTCSTCQSRQAECVYDIESSSVRTGALKQRIRDLESSNASLVADGVNLRSTQQELIAMCQSLSEQIEANNAQGSQDGSISVEDFAMSDTSTQMSPVNNRAETNTSFKGFLDKRRQSCTEHPGSNLYGILPPLDVTGFFDANHVPDELSHWAVQSSLTRGAEAILLSLAHAYITWLHLCWLISPSRELTSILAQVQAASRNMPAFLFIPHAIVVTIGSQGMESPVVSVEDSWGANLTDASDVLSNAMPQWQYMGYDATFIEESTGKTRLTQPFEAFVRGHRGFNDPGQTWRAQPEYATTSSFASDGFDL